jgi:tetratricopeptide (TPR) repeat protein
VDGELYLNMGVAASLCGQFKQGVIHLTWAIERGGLTGRRLALAYLNRALALAQQDRPRSALADLRRALELEPALAAAHLHAGDQLKALGRPQEALTAYSRSLELNPWQAETLVRRARLWLDSGCPSCAEADLDQALRLEPLLAEAFRLRSLARQAQGRPGEAAADRRRFQELSHGRVDPFPALSSENTP